ncbi:MAG: hypothetical protein C5B49_08075 [Bdellovibrio sp.]|nr:MAG: hypothetical protein C5B49_08075 [Bdellovibrio sp.]
MIRKICLSLLFLSGLWGEVTPAAQTGCYLVNSGGEESEIREVSRGRYQASVPGGELKVVSRDNSLSYEFDFDKGEARRGTYNKPRIEVMDGLKVESAGIILEISCYPY